MPDDPKEPKKRPDLTPLDLSDEDLDALAEITEADILRAQRKWQQYADPAYKNLLNADEEAPEENADDS